MAYIGNTASTRYVANRAASVYSGDGSTVAFTLEEAVGSDEDILVSVDGVIQEPSVAYVVSSGTTLTFDDPPSSNAGNNIFVYYLSLAKGSVVHPSNQNLSAGTGTFSGAITGGGLLTTGGNVVIPNAGNIGSVGDTDAISIASNGVVTFSAGIVGAGMDLLLDTTISSAVAQFDITSTHINSTHDSYFIYADLLPATDDVFLKTQVFVGGSIQTGDIYGSEAAAKSSSSYFNDNDTDHFKMSITNVGNAAGEGGTWWLNLHNVNKTDKGFCYAGDVHMYATGAQPTAVTIGGALIVANHANVVNGYRLFFSSGNIASGVVRVYGIRT